MIIDKVGSAVSYQPPVIGGSTPQPDVSGAQAHSQTEAIGHSARTVEKAAHAANQRMENVSSQIRFNVSNESGKTVVKMVDTQTNQVLLQIPNEQMVRIAQDPAKLQGLALNRKA
ncbi:MAG: flagellar protein FlaG [Thiobacillaceae bacterium]